MTEADLSMSLIILAAAVVTYMTRIGGYVLITRMTRIPPRMEAALNGVPAAVLTSLVAPTFFYSGWDVKIAIIAAGIVGLRFSPLVMLVAGWAVVMLYRHTIGS